MNDVTIKTDDLLAKLKENRDKHIQTYQDAVEGYQKISEEKLTKALKKVQSGEMISSVKLSVPRSHEEQYDEAIAMLEMSVDKETKLSRYEFNNYVLDSWVSSEEKKLLRSLALSSTNAAAYA